MEKTRRARTDGSVVHTWKIRGYALIREDRNDWGYWTVEKADHDSPDVTVRGYRDNGAEKVAVGVNWAACGIKVPEDAIGYAEKIKTAAFVAELFSEIALNYVENKG